jgi:tetratricopeptide (TPR) repeat protein
MVYGRLRSRRHRSRFRARGPKVLTACFRPRAIASAFAILLVIASLSSCKAALEKRRETAFTASLVFIDALGASSSTPDIDKAFMKAYRKAGRAPDWISVLKRAEASSDKGRDPRCAEAARLAVTAFPRSASLRAAAAHAYLRCGKSGDALALFGESMPPDSRPELWAEAFLSAGLSANRAARPSDYARLAEAIGESRPLVGAAAASLAAGDRISASAWLGKALEGGASVPTEILWDCGQYAEIARRPDFSVDATELELMGDAAWKTGDVETAKRRWARAAAISPKSSWRPYANLAMLSGTDGSLAESYWTRLKSAFLSEPPSLLRNEALGAYAAHLARAGRVKDASAVLGDGEESGRLAVLRLSILSLSMSEERYAIELERLAARRPDDAVVVDSALRELFRRGLYGEVDLLRRNAAGRKLPLEKAWFYEAATTAARGKYPSAASLIVAADGGPSSAEGFFALGSLHAALGDRGAAATDFACAAAMARSDRDKSAAYKAEGRELAASGDAPNAAKAYKRALAAEPSDAEAAILARGSGK